jgi:uncharacterized protein with PIN domain
MSPPRFAVDKMLGRLATWLRLIGLDTIYDRDLSGQALLRHARSEGRTVLTRDRRLLKRPPPPTVVLITSDHFRDQVRRVVDAFNLDPLACLFSRCTRCNTPLIGIPRADVTDRVPPYVLATQERYAQCPTCHRIYWSATHCEHVRHELASLGFRRTEH